MTKADSQLMEDIVVYSVSDCITLPLKEFAATSLETGDDKIILWQGADGLAAKIIAKLQENGYSITV